MHEGVDSGLKFVRSFSRMIQKVRGALRNIAVCRFVFLLLQDCTMDWRSLRFRSALLIYLANVLPDLFFCAKLRPVLWRLAGAQLKDLSTSHIRPGTFIEFAGNLRAGAHFTLHRGVYLCGNGPIDIGDHVTISMHSRILTIHHAGKNHKRDIIRPIIIKNHCLIYSNVTVLPGTILEEGVVVASGSVITGQTTPWTIYRGVPAIPIRARTDV